MAERTVVVNGVAVPVDKDHVIVTLPEPPPVGELLRRARLGQLLDGIGGKFQALRDAAVELCTLVTEEVLPNFVECNCGDKCDGTCTAGKLREAIADIDDAL